MNRFTVVINKIIKFIFPTNDQELLSKIMKHSIELQTVQVKKENIYYIYKYQDQDMKRALLKVKNYGLHEFVEFFSNAMCDALLELISERLDWERLNIVVCPVPLHKSKKAKRGFDQNLVLAKSLQQCFGEKANIHINANLLKRNKNTKEQKKLKQYERFQNLKDAFQISNKIALSEIDIIIVFDDITTSGATLLSAKQALLKACFRGEIMLLSIAH